MVFGQQNSKLNKGVPIIISGVVLTVCVGVTPLEYSPGPGSKITPYHLQTAQISGLVTGITLTGTGLITTILNRKSKKRKRIKR